MRKLTDREKRTAWLGGIALGAYLVLFYGIQGVRLLEAKRADYQRLLDSASALRTEALRENNRALRLARLKAARKIDLTAFRPESVVGEASAAIQRAAQAQGIQLGPSRETSGRSSAEVLSVIQMEGQGTTQAAARFLLSLRGLEAPVVVDSINLKTAGMKPGQVQLSLGIAVLNYQAWKPKGPGNA